MRGILLGVKAESEPVQESTAYTPLVWNAVGHQANIQHLTYEQVEKIHYSLVADFDGTNDPLSPAGVKSKALLESALCRPRTSNGGALKYSTIEMAAAALLHSLVHNHPFHNGNKRTALVSTLVFLDENQIALTCDQDALFKLVLQLAQHALVDGPRNDLVDRETMALALWIKANSRWMEQGDRTIPWRRLSRILSAYNCTFDHPSGVGNRINITRNVTKTKSRLFFGRSRTETVLLRTQTAYAGDGVDVQKSTIRKIRRDLQLDDDNGVDGRAFYDNEPMSPGDFIIRYRKTLRRLARL